MSTSIIRKFIAFLIATVPAGTAVSGCNICEDGAQCSDAGSGDAGQSTNQSQKQQCLNYCDRLSVCGASQAKDFDACVNSCQTRFRELPAETAQLCACIPASLCEDAVEGRCTPATTSSGGTSSTGGSPGSGGTHATGGSGGSGILATGGSGEAASTGGTHATGGTGGSGNASSSGGSGNGPATGGSGGSSAGSSGHGGAPATGGTAGGSAACGGASSGSAGEMSSAGADLGGSGNGSGMACTCDCQCPAAETCVDGHCAA